MPDFEMDLTDHHPTDRLLDPVAVAESTSMVVGNDGEPYEVPVPHEPSHEERQAQSDE